MAVVTNYSDLSDAMRAEILAVNPGSNFRRAERQDTLMALCRRGYAQDCGSRWFRLTDAGWAARRALQPLAEPAATITPEAALSRLRSVVYLATSVSEIRAELDRLLNCLNAAGRAID